MPSKYLNLVRREGVSQARLLVLAMLAALDEAVGQVSPVPLVSFSRNRVQVVDSLKENGEYENTVFVFTTDNGGSVSHAASNLPLRGTKVGGGRRKAVAEVIHQGNPVGRRHQRSSLCPLRATG